MAERKAEIAQESRLFRFTPENYKNGGVVAVSIVRDVGPVRALLSLVKAYPDLQTGYFVAYGGARDEVGRQVGILPTLNPTTDGFRPDVILTAGEVDSGLPNAVTEALKGLKPVSIWLEDTPNSLRNRTGVPDLVFCSSEESRAKFSAGHQDIPVNRVFTGVNPDILKVSGETAETGPGVRRKLGIGPEQLVVTFLGSKSTDIPSDPDYLEELSTVLEEKRKAGQDVVLIRRDHPGDPNPGAYDESTAPFKGRVIVMRQGSPEIRAVETNEVCAASDRIVFAASTVFQEISLRGALQDRPGRRGTLLITGGNSVSGDQSAVGKGIYLSATSGRGLADQIDHAHDPDLQRDIWEAQRRYSDPVTLGSNLQEMFDVISRTVYERQNPS